LLAGSKAKTSAGEGPHREMTGKDGKYPRSGVETTFYDEMTSGCRSTTPFRPW
jgi:hypothetical protein